MTSRIVTSLHTIHKSVWAVLLVGVISLAGWLGIMPTSYALEASDLEPAPESVEAREAAYDEAKDIASDPKMGVEKEYERNIEAYREEHADEMGIVGEVKELVNKVTGNE
ncbi:MAG: hypothetical protein IGS38_02130 [Synechococcales cyanobacterium M58_A2018_015]|nr:hypothetical protein [Synechococcales cyanobacterium M58_A2018_015]